MSVTARPDTETHRRFGIRPVSNVLGAEIIGLDLRDPLDAATREAVSAAFLDFQVLVFRDHDLDKQQQIAFTEQSGTLERHIGRNRGDGPAREGNAAERGRHLLRRHVRRLRRVTGFGAGQAFRHQGHP